MSKRQQHEVYKLIQAANTDASLGMPVNVETLLEQIDAVYAAPTTAEQVKNFLDQDKALCLAALTHDPDVLLRAIELIRNVERMGSDS